MDGKAHFWEKKKAKSLSGVVKEISRIANSNKKNQREWMELCIWFDKLEFSFFFFTYIEKLYPSACTIVLNSLLARGHRLSIVSSISQGIVVF